jgi:hypothetical protein
MRRPNTILQNPLASGIRRIPNLQLERQVIPSVSLSAAIKSLELMAVNLFRVKAMAVIDFYFRGDESYRFPLG